MYLPVFKSGGHGIPLRRPMLKKKIHDRGFVERRVMIELKTNRRCLLFGKPERPAVCSRLRPMPEMCGDSAQAAMIYLTELEIASTP